MKDCSPLGVGELEKMTSTSKVAVIGPQDSVASCLQESHAYPQLDLIAMQYESETEASEKVDDLGDDIDAVLFTGPIPYYMTRDMEELQKVPAVYIPFSGVGLYRALFQIRHLKDFSRVSIDTIRVDEVTAAYEDLNMTGPSPLVLEYSRALSSDEIVSFHYDLYRSGKTDAALTCLRSSHKELTRLGVPCERIISGPSLVRETLDRIVLITESIWNKGRQIAVGFIAVNGYDEWKSDKSVYDIQRFELQLNQTVFNYVKKLDGHFVQTGSGEYIFFTTRAMVERTTHQLTTSPLYAETVQLPPTLSFSLGIGFGATANSATENARIALDRAKAEGTNASFIMSENHELVGPLGSSSEAVTPLRITDDSLLDVAKEAGLSAASLSKLLNSIHYVGREFTANELAPFLGVTVRSTRRLLRYLESTGVLMVVGQESVHDRGKPRRVYRLR